MSWHFLAVVFAATVPVPGTTYATRFGMPMIGGQNIRVVILDRTRARIQLTGLLQVDGDVVYTRNNRSSEGGDEYTFALDQNLQSLLRRYGCSLSKARFNTKQDTASVTLNIKSLGLQKRLTLPRERLATF